jgi:hypothetical protein
MTLISPQLKKMSSKSSTRGGNNALSKTSLFRTKGEKSIVLFLPVLVCVFSTFFFFFFFFAERFQNHTLCWNHRKSYAFEKAYDFGTISLFSSLSTRRTTYSPIKLARKVGVCVLLLGIIIIKVLCVLHSLRGPTPVVVVLFFLVFFSSVLFLHFALFCAFYVYIRRRREDRFQSKIRHLARSQSHN